jgi:hypothetical protein
VFGNRVLRRIFGPKRDEVTEEWRKLDNEELNDLYSSPSIIRIMKSRIRKRRRAGACSTNGGEEERYRLLVEKPEGRPRRRWMNNIGMDLVEVGWGHVDWIGLAQDRNRWRALVNSALNLRVPKNAGKLSSILTTRDLSSSAQLHTVSQLVSDACM